MAVDALEYPKNIYTVASHLISGNNDIQSSEIRSQVSSHQHSVLLSLLSPSAQHQSLPVALT